MELSISTFQQLGARAPLLVAMSLPLRFRFTLEFRLLNAFTENHGYAMPTVKQELAKLKGFKIYTNVEFCHGYWQFPLYPDSQEIVRYSQRRL